ncbi:MAG: 5-methyltetrahydropteroyltriglutamate--homocysteine S-methyltransferase [Thermoflexus sp.]|uniref:5-methyltetrahydropteroyltriglutamate-- homocysteine S-methyltransferase n=1 Tax=Thermoflexus sp. TaxID=1969742 RepID=UPI0025EDBA0C|nr:5-methyltetrahydropteroyltriglutamate--homocysteine S-methyltransferase [Thermoflexus sp.]MCS6963655.1 5-methyltetrahydropteroyltriglutamate--homocysteine S-methyltransferase [Thermoflexus sp.]MDW8185578.1 5-methyltetrahydropteroyltriglutamate--homocysteine S-methyltransferase [Anaerolineae bacterium]
MRTYAYGYPRLGRKREYKTLIEGFWAGKIPEAELIAGLEALEAERLETYRRFVDGFPAGEMSLYDPMLDTALILGLYPNGGRLEDYFALARGERALELTKWFNTNYHYLVPEIPFFGGKPPAFRLAWNKPLEAFRKAPDGFPYVIGPYTFLRLSKGYPPEAFGALLRALLPAYAELFRSLKAAGAAMIHVDEPAWAMDVPPEHVTLLREAYAVLGREADLLVFTYYDSVDFLEQLYDLPLRGLGLDLRHGEENLEAIRRSGFPADKILIAGVVDGRNVWKTDLQEAARRIEALRQWTSAEIWISNAGPLYHLPVTVEAENRLDAALRERIAFAAERLMELRLLKGLMTGEGAEEARRWNTFVHPVDRWHRPEVRERVSQLRPEDFSRGLPYAERIRLQRERLPLPLFPTTTIGSFPQTEDLRRARTAYRAGKLSEAEYRAIIRERIQHVIRIQEELGLDVLVHGEFERSDMVEFFAERLEGFAFTQHGWILSYGTRVYRPPILYGDVSRPRPMTVEEIAYAQSLTDKPVKGMLTGPVTMLAWSFVREDIPVREVAFQVALAIQDEVRDLETAGIRVIQIDEPAFRERAPLKRRRWPEYFDWAVKAFRLASRARPETQIHTHMCYSEFNEIIEYIDALDADVISIEATRSRGEVIGAFERHRYERQIGPGVYDVHSPAVPAPESMEAIIERAVRVIPVENVWVNPDCGLKTRRWEEVIPALRNMVWTAQHLRERYRTAVPTP